MPSGIRKRQMNVFLLWHTHEMPSGEEDSKLIGVYSSEEMAVKAKERSLKQPGFRDIPDGFLIDKYEIDSDN